MTDLSHYSLTLLGSSSVQLHRGTHPTLANALFVTTHESEDYRYGDGVRQLNHEFALRAELHPSWALQPTGLLHRDNRPVLMLDDPGGDPLRLFCGNKLAVKRFLPLALGITTALSRLHDRRIVHCNLSADTLFVVNADGDVRLTGFGCALRESANLDADVLRDARNGTVKTMAPELCGQMKEHVDFRADLYSLGCVFYEMLTGTLPVAGDDRLSLVHAHLARYPSLPSEKVAGIPRQIEMIVMKLLEKDPGERYQSATSLAADLERCAALLRSGQTIALFPLDAPARFRRHRISHQLFGRDKEIHALSAAFERSMEGGSAGLVVVSGYSGAGKSSLVNQWIDRSDMPPHRFASGTCEQVNHATPYTALLQIIEQLVRPILGQDEAAFNASRHRLLDALGTRAQMLWDMVPDLQLILGDQLPPDSAVIPADRPRFLKASADLISTFSRPDCPLVLFFDDLQWADEGTISALTWLSENATANVLLIGAYRSNEVSADHPLQTLIEARVPAENRIRLSPLDPGDTALLVASTLGCSIDQVSSVVNLVHEKTGGNPFFVSQFSIELAQEGLIGFEHQSTLRVRDIDRIRAKAYSDNVVDLMLRRFDRIDPATQSTLRHFACLGSVATLQSLATAMHLEIGDVPAAFDDAAEAGLVYRDSDTYCFTHDRFREAAYGSMSERERVAMHLDIGRSMVAGIVDDENCEALFDIVSQIGLGVGNVTSAAERHRFATLNVVAATRARNATAYTSALTYLVAAAALVADLPGDEVRETRQWIEFWRADCECLTGNLEPAKARLAALSSQDIDMVLRAELTRLSALLHTAQNRADLGIEAGLDYLRRMGLVIESRPDDAQVQAALVQFEDVIGERSIAELDAIPDIVDPLWHSAIDVLADMIPPALFIDVNLLDVLLLQIGALSIKHGLCDASAFGFVFLNSVYGARLGKYERSYAFGELGMRVIDRYGASRYKSRVYMRFGSLVLPWSRPASEAMPIVEKAYRISSEIGNMVFEVSSSRNVTSLLLLTGSPVGEIEREANKGLAIARASRFFLYADLFGAQLEMLQILRDTGFPRDSNNAPGAGLFTAALKDAPERNTTSNAFSIWSYRLQAVFLFGELSAALEAERMCLLSLRASSTILEVIDFRFYATLSRSAACARSATATDAFEGSERAHFAALQEHFAHLSQIARSCPDNFGGRHALARAQMARLDGNLPEAQRCYEEAIRHAATYRTLQVEALAHELAAEFHSDLGEHDKARGHLRAASDAYANWGAGAKVDHLTARHDDLLRLDRVDIHSRAATFSNESLDIAAVIKMSNAMASEIVLNKLIETLLSTAMQHAGAQRGILLLSRDGTLHIEAEGRVESARIAVELARVDLSSQRLPVSIVQAVVRTARHLVLDNACEVGSFADDDFIRNHRCRSIVCVPLLKQKHLVGVLFMENDLAIGMFSASKTAVLTVVGSQAAIALENARLYEDAIEQNRARAHAEEALRNALANLAHVTRLTTMGELVASIVHEVSQPLMAIQTSAGAALRWLTRDVPDIVEAKDMIGNVVADSLRASKVIQGLRAMARQTEPVMTVFELGAAIREVLMLLRGQMRDHDVDLNDQWKDDVLVEGDRVQVQQVVLNLIVNAMEAMASVDDRPRVLTLSSAVDDSLRVKVSVADTGPGLGIEVVDRVFEPFVTTKKSGMGMGLSICRSIIEAHDGRLEAVPHQPFGTLFSFTLPIASLVSTNAK